MQDLLDENERQLPDAAKHKAFLLCFGSFGIKWEKNDTLAVALKFALESIEKMKFTKRSLHHTTTKLFDPVGLERVVF